MVAVGSTHPERSAVFQGDRTVAVGQRAQSGDSVEPNYRRPMNAEKGSCGQPLLYAVQ